MVWYQVFHPTFLFFTPWSLDLFICVPSKLNWDYTELQPFRHIEISMHISISVLSGTHFYLSQAKHLEVKCLAQGHNIEIMSQNGMGRKVIFLWKSCTKRDSKPLRRQRHRHALAIVPLPYQHNYDIAKLAADKDYSGILKIMMSEIWCLCLATRTWMIGFPSWTARPTSWAVDHAIHVGDRVVHDGGHVVHDGEHAAHDGERVVYDGERAVRDGERAVRDGERAVYDGDRAVHDGERAVYDGERAVRDGERAVYDGEPAVRDGERAVYDGERAVRDGERAVYDGDRAVHNGERAVYYRERAVYDGERAVYDEERAAHVLYDLIVQPKTSQLVLISRHTHFHVYIFLLPRSN